MFLRPNVVYVFIIFKLAMFWLAHKSFTRSMIKLRTAVNYNVVKVKKGRKK